MPLEVGVEGYGVKYCWFWPGARELTPAVVNK